MSTAAAPREALPSLTSLRFFAACYVLLFHTRGGVFFRAGYLGVTLFFVLSGFILAYNHPVVAPGQRKRFYVARFARIYPLYIVSYCAMLPEFLNRIGPHHTRYLAATSTLYLLLLHTWYPPFHFVINAGAWTLTCEAVFYLIFPFVVTRMARFQKHWLATALGLWLLLFLPSVLTEVVWLRASPGAEPFIHALLSLPLFHVGEFLLGITLGLHFLDRRPVFRGWHVLLALALCIVSLAAAGQVPSRFSDFVLNGALALPFGLLILTTAGWKSRFLAHPLMQLGGEISYSIYLMQWTLVQIVQTALHHYRGLVALRFGLFLGLAYLSYRFIEKPARLWVLRAFGVRSHSKPIETPGVAIP